MLDKITDLMNFDTLFTLNNDEEMDDLWRLSHDDELLDMAELKPLSPVLKADISEKVNSIQVKPESVNKRGLKLDTNLVQSLDGGYLKQFEEAKVNGIPTATLPAHFALLSTTCIYEPGYTTSPRGKRRISQTQGVPFGLQHDEAHKEDSEDAENGKVGDDVESHALINNDLNLPVFTNAELSAMIDLPSNLPTTTTSAAPSPVHGIDDPMPYSYPDSSSMSTDVANLMYDQEIPVVISMFSSIFDESQNFHQQLLDHSESTNGNAAAPASPVVVTGQIMPPGAPVLPRDIANAASISHVAAVSKADPSTSPEPFDYFSPSGYANAANQFLGSYGQQVQPFFLNREVTPNAAVFPSCQQVPESINSQLVASMTMANTTDLDTMNCNYRGAKDGRGGRLQQSKVAQPSKSHLPALRAASASATTTSSSKLMRLAFTPDIADFKLVQIFHQFCDPVAMVLTLPRFQQLLLFHQIKEESAGPTNSATETKQGGSDTANSIVVTSEAETIFKALDINSVGALDLERFMHSYQICNRCTEVKRRANQALCASQGQMLNSTALERHLMEDVVPVVVRVVPTSFEGHKVKSCDHYQWTWCEGFEKTGNDKCRGTNRHDKCPKYLANCTLWKHKLPPKSRKPKLQQENPMGNTCCSWYSKSEPDIEDHVDASLENKLLEKQEDDVEVTTAEEEAWRQRREQLRDEQDMSMKSNDGDDPEDDVRSRRSHDWDLSDHRADQSAALEDDNDNEAFGIEEEIIRDSVNEYQHGADEAIIFGRLTQLTAEDSYATNIESIQGDDDLRVFRDSEQDSTTALSVSLLQSSSPSSYRGSTLCSSYPDEIREQDQQIYGNDITSGTTKQRV
ncbi:hypothetical protein CCR75_001669 [Bremia lactucae]|uniref:Uncharacterized protein n=1 Tax=Bremia lactucae TaxID=4779 RepID=A0A976IG20_BRELC|nr:hypothetical protein CCR75_001669 [Bremia lactucae]